MVTKVTRDVLDLNVRAVTDGIKIEGNCGAEFRMDGVPIGLNAPCDGVFVNLTTTNLTVTANIDGPGIVPIGTVLMFNAAFAGIPANFQLCDGTNGTPDMTDQFVYGTNTEGELLDTGGSADAVVVSHNHGLNDPGHTHDVFGSLDDGSNKNTCDQGNNTRLQTNTSGNSSTGISIDSAGESGTGKNLPPFIKLAFIQRMS